MSMKRITAAGGTLLALGFFAGSLEGCGSSASDNKALCKNACDKTLMCHPELAPFLVNCEQQCNTMTGASGGTSCKNQSAIIAKFNECLGKPCGAAYDACTAAIPDCEGGGGGGGGTGGTTGSGGSASGTGGSGTGGSGTGGSGTGGSGSDASAGGTCETCTKADACCTAFIQGFDGGQCEFAAGCSAATGNDRTQLVEICRMFLMNFSANPAAPAACK